MRGCGEGMTPTLAQPLAPGNPWTSSTLRKFHVVPPALKREEITCVPSSNLRPLCIAYAVASCSLS